MATPIPHGTLNGYQYHGCRCAECRSANHEKSVAWRSRLSPEMANAHGVISTYTQYRCRCDACRIAWSAYQRSWRARRKATR